jgi:hypothetical protein
VPQDEIADPLPQAIRSDNSVPFASPNSLFNLSKLAVWWLRLGIAIERIKPGHPQQNGRHERHASNPCMGFLLSTGFVRKSFVSHHHVSFSAPTLFSTKFDGRNVDNRGHADHWG